MQSVVAGAPSSGSFEGSFEVAFPKDICSSKLNQSIGQKSLEILPPMVSIVPFVGLVRFEAWSQDGFLLAMQIATIGGS